MTTRIKFLIPAILIPLCWIPLAMLDAYLVNQKGVFGDTEFTPWQKMSFLRFIICGLFFWILVPLILRKKFGNSYANIVGLNFKKTDFLALILFLVVPFAVNFLFKNPLVALHGNVPTVADFVANIQPPMIEEVAFRGIFFYLMYKGGFQNWVIILVGALLFGGIHIPFYGWQAGITGAISIVLFILPRLFSRNICQGFLLHFMANSGLMFPVFIGNCIVFLIMMVKNKVGVKNLIKDYNQEKY